MPAKPLTSCFAVARLVLCHSADCLLGTGGGGNSAVCTHFLHSHSDFNFVKSSGHVQAGQWSVSFGLKGSDQCMPISIVIG